MMTFESKSERTDSAAASGASSRLSLPVSSTQTVALKQCSVGLTENDGHENDGPKMTAGREVAGEQNSFPGPH